MRFLISVLAGVFAVCVASEVALQFMPVNSGVRMAESGDAHPYARYLPKQPYVYSFGWAMNNTHRGVTSAEGFNNSRDFRDGANALVIGDSFIESFMVDYPDTVQGRLDAALGKVYAAALSGNGLADALVLSRHFLPKIHASNVVLFVEPYDLRGIAQPNGRGHNAFEVRPEGVEVRHNPYSESSLKEKMLKSALLRYVYYNLKLPEWAKAAKPVAARSDAGTLAAEAAEREQALDYLMGELGALRKQYGTRFIFLVDGDRNALYSNGKSKPNWMPGERESLLRHAHAHGYDVIDMQPVFEAHWKRYRERMDWLPMDGHWNPVAHRLAAERVLALVQPGPKHSGMP